MKDAPAIATSRLENSPTHDVATPIPIHTVLTEYLQKLDEPRPRPESSASFATGTVDLDVVLGGLQRGRVHLLCGQPGVGKTAWAIQVAGHVVQHQNAGVLFVTGRTGREEVARRFLASGSGVDLNRLRLDTIAPEHRDQLTTAVHAAADLPLFILTLEKRTRKHLVPAVEAAHAGHSIGLVIVDDVPALLVYEARDFLKALRRIAKRLNVAVLATIATRDGDDWASPGATTNSIVSDVGVYIELRRPGMHERDNERIGLTDFHVLRHKDGPTGIVTTRFIAATGTIRDLGNET